MTNVDQVQLTQLLASFLNKENGVRQGAESAFNNAKQTNPDGLMIGLIGVLRQCPEQHVRQQAAIAIRTVLRDFLLHRPDSIWKHLSQETKQTLKAELLNVLEIETSKVVRRSVCDTVSDLAAELFINGEWPEINIKLMELIDSKKANSQSAGLKILGDLVPQMSDIIKANIQGVARIVLSCSKSEDPDVRYQCLCLVASLVQSESRSVWKHVQECLPDIINGLCALVQNHMEDLAADFLVKLVEIADSSAGFFKPHLAPFVTALFAMARNSDAGDDVRQMAVETLLCVVEDKPRMCLKLPDFVHELIGCLLQMMLTIEDDADWIDNVNAVQDTDSTRNYDVGEAGLDRVAAAMGGDEVIKVVFDYVAQYLRHEEWQYKLVAIMAISQTAEYLLEDNIESHLAGIVDMLLIQLNDPHHRVRFAACQAIGQIALDHMPLFQRNYANVIMPALIRVLSDAALRVQAHAAAAIVNFAEEVDKPDLMPFADELMHRLFERISPGKPRMIREQCVTAIAVVAGVLEKDFLPYHQTVMPAMKEILVKSVTKEDRTIRGKALECISIIGLSVGPSVFQSDAHEIMTVLLQIAGAGITSDDPVKEYIQEAFCRFCRILKAEFVPYLPHLVPDVLKALSVKPEVVSEDNDDVEDMTLVSIADGTYSGLKTSVIEEMIHAADLLTSFVEILGARFGDYIVPAAETVLPLLSFAFSDDVKRSSLNALAELLAAARETGCEKAVLSNWIGQILEKVFNDLSPNADDVQIADLDLMVAETTGLAKCLRNAGADILNNQQVAAICEKVFALMRESSQRRAEIATRKSDPEFDEEDVTRLEEEEGTEQTLRSTLLEIIAAVMSLHPDLYLQSGAALCKGFIETHLHPNCTADDRSLALYVSDDVLENLQDKGIGLWSSFAERLVESLNDNDASVRQAAAYGVIQAAKCSQFPTELIQRAATRLVAVLDDSQSLQKGFLSATDNAIAALGSVVLRKGALLQPSARQYLDLWIEKLPLKVDDEEGRLVHSELVTLLTKGSPEIMGPNNQNLPKLVAICATIYKTEFSNQKTDEGIVEFMKALGFDVISSIGATFDKKHQKGLERIHRDATAKDATG